MKILMALCGLQGALIDAEGCVQGLPLGDTMKNMKSMKISMALHGLQGALMHAKGCVQGLTLSGTTKNMIVKISMALCGLHGGLDERGGRRKDSRSGAPRRT